MKKKESCLEILKKDYKKIQIKHKLPAFEKLNEDFQIEKAAEVETDFLIREIRRVVSEKLSNYLKFIDTLLHPINVPVFVFSIVKALSYQDKKILEDIYKKLIEIEMKLVELDAQFSEEKEADFIKSSDKEWQIIKKDILKVTDSIKKNWGNKLEFDSKGYFG